MLEYLQTLFAPYKDGLCEIRCLPATFPAVSEAALAANRCSGTLPPRSGIPPTGKVALTGDVVGRCRCRYFGRPHLTKAVEYARTMRDTHDVYIGVLPRALARSGGGGRDKDIHEAAWLWADIDAHGATVPEMGAFLHGMHSRLPAPQMCVLSGSGGAHVYWHLSVPESLTTLEVRQKFADTLRRLAKVIGGTDGGIHADTSTCNPSRILRVPGTFNHKQDSPTLVQGVLCAPTDLKTLWDWRDFLPCEPHPPAKQRNEIAYLSLRGARLGGRDTDPISPGLRAWADKGYPEGQRHTRLTGDAAWLRRSTDLPEPLALELFRTKAQASPGKHPLTEIELDGIWRWA